MNYKFINALMFAAGAAVGSAVTWVVVKKRYEKIAQEEIESVKSVFAEVMADYQTSDDEDSNDESDEERPRVSTRQINWDELEDLDEFDAEEETEYQANQADMAEYGRLTSYYTNKEGGAENMTRSEVKDPYVIAPYDFGEIDGYNQVSLTYYADDVLEDDNYDIVMDREELIGRDSLFTFGEYEEDSVFVRNERLRTDFEILKDYRTYSQARSIGPDQVDNE